MPRLFSSRRLWWTSLLGAALLAAGCSSVAPEDTIRQNLTERQQLRHRIRLACQGHHVTQPSLAAAFGNLAQIESRIV